MLVLFKFLLFLTKINVTTKGPKKTIIPSKESILIAIPKARASPEII
jgi:hypothetical protein